MTRSITACKHQQPLDSRFHIPPYSSLAPTCCKALTVHSPTGCVGYWIHAYWHPGGWMGTFTEAHLQSRVGIATLIQRYTMFSVSRTLDWSLVLNVNDGPLTTRARGGDWRAIGLHSPFNTTTVALPICLITIRLFRYMARGHQAPYSSATAWGTSHAPRLWQRS